MSYKLIKISVLSTIFLIGCGEESKREENEYEKNMLTIEAENFNDKVNLNVKEEEYSLIAQGNSSDVTLYFNKPDKTELPIYGELQLLAESNKARFASLAWINKYNDVSVLFCINYEDCSDNTEYSFDNDSRQLNVRFKNNFNKLWKNYLVDWIEKKDLTAKITGYLELKIPSNWLAFKKDRFPKKEGIGNLKVDSQIYKLSEMNSDINFYKDANGEYIGSVDQLNFKKGDDSVNIEIYEGIEDSQSFKDIRLKIYNYNKNNESFFLFDDLIPASFVSWNEDGKILSINIEKLILVNRENSKTKILDLKFNIPRNTSNLTINNEKILILRQDYSFAYVINDQKKYAITLVGQEGNYPLEIIQEFNGNITIETIKENEKIVCGGRYKPCLGVSMENDKKTFRFNNVKLGKDVLDGTIYIPGVID
ncbi:hypothetical protein [Acinetobacter nosocomialis]|uniref:hypothetical protein n=1 Tax=Acinetobacter nosocomialis TaxID=106654 RepID=UPI0024493409|nr:hypothetical protein [Acinetobacter nosocomialis]MDH2593400.1 hypothetical protein [Acinetobacter nosocomialis]